MKCPALLLEATRYSHMVLEVNHISADKVDLNLYREDEDGALEGRCTDNQVYYTKEYSEGGGRHLPRTIYTTVS